MAQQHLQPTITKEVQDLIDVGTGLAMGDQSQEAEVRAAALDDAGFRRAAREIRRIIAGQT